MNGIHPSAHMPSAHMDLKSGSQSRTPAMQFVLCSELATYGLGSVAVWAKFRSGWRAQPDQIERDRPANGTTSLAVPVGYSLREMRAGDGHASSVAYMPASSREKYDAI